MLHSVFGRINVRRLPFQLSDFILLGAANMVRTGVYFNGGITGSLRIPHMADSFGMKAQIHGNGSANLHLACAISNNSHYEIIVYSELGFVSPTDRPGTDEHYD